MCFFPNSLDISEGNNLQLPDLFSSHLSSGVLVSAPASREPIWFELRSK